MWEEVDIQAESNPADAPPWDQAAAHPLCKAVRVLSRRQTYK
jgi:hypothetical protein